MATKTQAASAAIVTTLRDADSVLESFVRYHLGIGFGHLFLFFDDPHTKIPSYVLRDPRITAIPRDLDLHYAWATTHAYTIPKISRHISSEVMSRQILNAEVALRKAYRLNINWLLHIDIDELFYLDQGTVESHFSELARNNIDCVQYANLEAVPEQRHIEDYFKEVTLFKINPSAGENAGLIQKHSRRVRQIPQIPSSFFHYYNKGKAAVRVGPSTLPKGVHNFSIPPAGKRESVFKNACILHYPCCGLNHFTQKYKTLGKFEDRWFGGGSELAIKLKSHLDGRDILQTNDEAQIESYYLKQRMISNNAHIEWLQDTKLAQRIVGPSQFLRGIAANGYSHA